jgi:hypothetical protein
MSAAISFFSSLALLSCCGCVETRNDLSGGLLTLCAEGTRLRELGLRPGIRRGLFRRRPAPGHRQQQRDGLHSSLAHRLRRSPPVGWSRDPAERTTPTKVHVTLPPRKRARLADTSTWQNAR